MLSRSARRSEPPGRRTPIPTSGRWAAAGRGAGDRRVGPPVPAWRPGPPGRARRDPPRAARAAVRRRSGILPRRRVPPTQITRELSLQEAAQRGLVSLTSKGGGEGDAVSIEAPAQEDAGPGHRDRPRRVHRRGGGGARQPGRRRGRRGARRGGRRRGGAERAQLHDARRGPDPLPLRLPVPGAGRARDPGLPSGRGRRQPQVPLGTRRGGDAQPGRRGGGAARDLQPRRHHPPSCSGTR